MKKLTKLMSAVLTITLLAGALVFPGAAWEYTVSPWAVAELTEAVELGLQNKDFYQKYDGKSSWDDIDREDFAHEVEYFIAHQLRLGPVSPASFRVP